MTDMTETNTIPDMTDDEWIAWMRDHDEDIALDIAEDRT